MTYPSPAVPAQNGASQQQRYVPQNVDEVDLGGEGGIFAPFLKVGPATTKRPAHSAPGEWKGGRIVAIRKVHASKRGAYDQATGKYGREYLYYKTGKKVGQPIEDINVIVQTSEIDPAIEGDTGLRTMELSGLDKYWEPTAHFNCTRRAARLAVDKAGAKSLQVGGEYYVCWTRTVQVVGLEIDPIDWAGHYVPPGNSIDLAAEAAAAAPVVPAPAPVVAPPVQAPAPAPAPVAPPAVAQPGFPPPPVGVPAPAAQPAAVPSWAQ